MIPKGDFSVENYPFPFRSIHIADHKLQTAHCRLPTADFYLDFPFTVRIPITGRARLGITS
jgi:hypothetical protein